MAAAAAPSAAAATTSSSSSTIFSSLGGGVEICIFGHLHPVDLFSFSLTSHQLRERIQTNLIQILSIQRYYHNKVVPIQLGVHTNYLVELLLLNDHNESSYRRTILATSPSFFRSKGDLVTFVLDRLHYSQLLLAETTSIHESEAKAKQLFLDQNKSSAMFYSYMQSSSANNKSSNGDTTANDDGQNKNSRQTRRIMAECHFQSNSNKDSATSWIDYILNRDAFTRYGKDRIHNRYIRDWLMYILSSSLQPTTSNSNYNNNNIQIWRWGCKHPNLSGKGVSGVGVMISLSSSDTADDQKLELRLTRLY